MEEEKILNVTQLQVVDKIQNDDVILLIRDTGNGKQCFQIKGSDFRGESAYEAALKQGFVGTYQDWTQHIKEITKYNSKPKTQYIIGKAIPIGKLNGGARLNAYAASSSIFRFKLSRIPQLGDIIRRQDLAEEEKLLKNVTWHLFINDRHITDTSSVLTCYGQLLVINAGEGEGEFYELDESKSSVDLSSDMYIYLRLVYAKRMRNFKGTSETLYYCNSKRIWEPFINSPFINRDGYFDIDGSYRKGDIQLQKLLTCQRRSKKSGLKGSISKFGYRGRRDSRPIDRGGFYRYRIVYNGKKTQWRTINILKKDNHFLIK